MRRRVLLTIATVALALVALAPAAPANCYICEGGCYWAANASGHYECHAIQGGCILVIPGCPETYGDPVCCDHQY